MGEPVSRRARRKRFRHCGDGGSQQPAASADPAARYPSVARMRARYGAGKASTTPNRNTIGSR